MKYLILKFLVVKQWISFKLRILLKNKHIWKNKNKNAIIYNKLNKIIARKKNESKVPVNRFLSQHENKIKLIKSKLS
jgi:hypothetical protein